MAGSVKAIVSKKVIQFTPDSSYDLSNVTVNEENEFDVTVINESDKFASFQVELLTAGLDENSHVKWYKIYPEVCTKKPPGSETTFHVAIIKAPITVYDTTIDVIIKIFSVEYERLYTSQKISLTINKPLRSLRVEMPIKELKVTLGNQIEIPVIVSNLSPKFTEIQLSLSGLNPDWFTIGTQRKLQIEPGDSQKISFLCQPTKGNQTLSKEYKFTIDAGSNTSQYTTREQGILEVLPDGVVEFSCSNKQQTIPSKGRKQSNSAIYELILKNDSNLLQRVHVIVPQKEHIKIGFGIPEAVNIIPGDTKSMHLEVNNQRPWLGRRKRQPFEVSVGLTNPNSGEPSTFIFPIPNTQILELIVLPIIPFILQIGSAAIIPLLLLLNLWLHPRVYHTGAVNSVRLVGKAGKVVSGSSDQTIRLWQVNDGHWQLNGNRLKYEGEIASETENKKAVRVIRSSPMDDGVIAAGLDSGDIQLWDTLKRQKKPVYSGTDRVFDLAFSQNPPYLFSGHGSGQVRQWDLTKTNKKPINIAYVKFAIYALAITENQIEPDLIFIAGRYNKLAVWDWSKKIIYEIPYEHTVSELKKGFRFKPFMSQQNYITSLTTANNKLAISDNQGYITLWDVNKIRQCINKEAEQQLDISKNIKIINGNKKNNSNKNITSNQIKPLECEQDVIAQSSEGHHKQPVRSIALTQSACHLASVGDDGQVILWDLSKDKIKNLLVQSGTTLIKENTKFNSVDIKALKDDQDDYVLITIGDDNYNVKLYRVNGIKDNANCK
ncbi:hypothetical protein [Nostoc sp. NMS9]|uniref:hypothetical protein n=1 Tax=Nostoc sp. NMS9 TaxID=2815393 RepID=UPI0025E6FC70|nr:hypothetical protein [Nostoc sp. NMS9]MBN3941577.1 hypothetical protein [Nostoc sp. NMS9]